MKNNKLPENNRWITILASENGSILAGKKYYVTYTKISSMIFLKDINESSTFLYKPNFLKFISWTYSS